MKLLDIENEILAAITLKADATVLEIARHMGVRPHSCRHALDRMLGRGIISRRVVVNPARLGYRIFGLWFSLAPRTSAESSKIVKFLKASPQISYLGEFSGEYEWRIDILARSLTEADEVIGQISRMNEDVFSDRRLTLLMSVYDFPLKALSRKERRPTATQVDLESPEIRLHEMDIKILRELTADGSQSQAALARKLGMPASTLTFRINQLREKEVIVGYHLLPEVETLRDYEVSFRLHRIRLRHLGSEVRARLLEFCASDPSVHGLTQCIGDSDADICSAATSVLQEREFEIRLKKTLGPLLSGMSVLRMVKHHKVNACPPVVFHEERRGLGARRAPR